MSVVTVAVLDIALLTTELTSDATFETVLVTSFIKLSDTVFASIANELRVLSKVVWIGDAAIYYCIGDANSDSISVTEEVPFYEGVIERCSNSVYFLAFILSTTKVCTPW